MTRNTYTLTLFCTLLLSILLLTPPSSVVNAQLTSSTDADGNIVVLSVGTDDTGALSTTTIETIEAGAATTSPAPGVGANAAATTSQVSINLGQANSSPTSSSSRAPPTTYLVYFTVNGQQTSAYSTFTASTPSTPPPLPPSSGTVLAYSDYITATPTNTKKTGAAVPARKLSSKNGQIAAFGVLLSMLVGAIVVF